MLISTHAIRSSAAALTVFARVRVSKSKKPRLI